MEFILDYEQLQLKSEHLYTDPKHVHFHDGNENELLISWNNCVTVVYFLNNLTDATLWCPIEPLILPISNPVLSVLTFDSKVYCIDKIGTIYQLKQVLRDSPDLFDCSPPTELSPKPLLCKYEWISSYSQKCPCNVFKATCYSNGIALIIAVGEWIVVQLLSITFNDDNEPIILDTCKKQIRLQKKFPFLVTSFLSCTWRDWFNSQRATELFGPSVLDCQDVFIIATEESKIYCTTSDVLCKTVKLFLNCLQKVVHIQFCNLETKKLVFVTSSGILMVMQCCENIPPSFIYLAIVNVVTTIVIDQTIILSDGVNLFLTTLDNQFSKIIKQVITSLKGVFTLLKFQFNDIIAITQVSKFYKLTHKFMVITDQEELKFKFNEKYILENIKDLCKNIETLEEQHKRMDQYISAVSVVARKDFVAEHCSVKVLIYSGSKAIKLGAHQDEYILAIKLSIDCTWLSFPSAIWQLLIRVIDSKNLSSNCGVYPFDVNLFNSNHPLTVKHHLLATIAKNCSSGSVCCELVCQIQSDLTNHCLVIPLNPVELNALYFIKAEKREKIPVMNPMVDQHRYIFKYPEYLSLEECINIITNRNKHRISRSLYKNIVENKSKTLYLNFFEKIVLVTLDDKSTKTIILESIGHEALIAVRNGFFNELSNYQSVIIKPSVLADVQKQLCLIEGLSMEDRHDINIVKEMYTKIQNQISANLPI